MVVGGGSSRPSATLPRQPQVGLCGQEAVAFALMADNTVDGGSDVRFDVAIVGAGVAGLVAALDLLDLEPALRIAVIDKGEMGSSGSTPLAQGGMAAAVGPDDSPEMHAEDTIRAGDGLCDERAVAVMAVEGPARVDDLIRRGARFDRTADGSLALAREGGQRVARNVRTADASGAEIFRALRVAASGRVTRLQGIACAIATAATGRERGVVAGVWVVLDAVDGSPLGPAQTPGLALVRADAVLLATGGCGGLFAATTNRDGATADGIGLAAGIGAALVDLEFIQFHPTGLKVSEPGSFWRLLLTEALRGAGATLVDATGRRFMPERHPDGELAPRHIVTKGILDQDGGVWLDATALPKATLEQDFPTVAAGVRRHGFDLATEPVPVEPAQHYMIGGVATDLWARTSVPGMYAAGEVAATGVHGANRMAGNSLLQSCVFGHRAASAIRAQLRERAGAAREVGDAPLLDGNHPADGLLRRASLRVAMSAGAGPIRTAAGLLETDRVLDETAAAIGKNPAPTRDSIELHHMVAAGRLFVRSAQLREESRGVHWRGDFPHHDPRWSGVRLRVQGPRTA
ncbi:MAG: FAD-dependent oxidoreductase [Nitriliruptorales bacterium]|nr:FAD-dependent oxidoreductase [Nitriliruptorales bacterium]